MYSSALGGSCVQEGDDMGGDDAIKDRLRFLRARKVGYKIEAFTDMEGQPW